jgi:hypothetical protein
MRLAGLTFVNHVTIRLIAAPEIGSDEGLRTENFRRGVQNSLPHDSKAASPRTPLLANFDASRMKRVSLSAKRAIGSSVQGTTGVYL